MNTSKKISLATIEAADNSITASASYEHKGPKKIRSHSPMTAVESLLPTHARLARAAGESSPCIAKYIVIAGPDGEPAPILFPATIMHRDGIAHLEGR